MLEALDARYLIYDSLIQQTRDSTEAVAEGGNLFTLLSAVREHEDQRTRLCAEPAMLDTLTMAPFDPVAVEQELHNYLKGLALARAGPPRTDAADPSKLLPNRIRVWREVRGREKVYHFEGEAAVGKLFNGFVNIERAAQTAVIENGFVWIPNTAPWLADYVQELTTFPKAKYDDQADSTAQALQWIQASQRIDTFECDWGTGY